VALHRCAQQAKALAGIEYNTTRPLPVELFAACPADHNAYLDVIRTYSIAPHPTPTARNT
jgi:hypothetical protein